MTAQIEKRLAKLEDAIQSQHRNRFPGCLCTAIQILKADEPQPPSPCPKCGRSWPDDYEPGPIKFIRVTCAPEEIG